MKKRELKFWNGRGWGIYQEKHMSVAAYSRAQAARLLSAACFEGHEGMISVYEIKNYYHQCWGTYMKDVVATEPCVYVNERYSVDPPKKVL